MPAQSVLVIQNDAKEGSGMLGRILSDRGLEQHVTYGWDLDRHEFLRHFGALVILGGAQSAYETDTYPYLRREMDLCGEFVADDKPVAGFCLGAQILALAVGGEVVAGTSKEIGWYDLRFNQAAVGDPLTSGSSASLTAYHFHGDIIRPARNCTNLASSERTECQLFRAGSKAYGFQYHAEADAPLIEVMCRNNVDYLTANGFDADHIISRSQVYSAEFERHSRSILNRWVDMIR